MLVFASSLSAVYIGQKVFINNLPHSLFIDVKARLCIICIYMFAKGTTYHTNIANIIEICNKSSSGYFSTLYQGRLETMILRMTPSNILCFFPLQSIMLILRKHNSLATTTEPFRPIDYSG